MNDFKKFIDLWKKIMFILSPSHKRLGFVVFVMSLMGSVAELLGVSIILPFAQVMVEPEKLRSKPAISDLCDVWHIDTDGRLVIACTVAVIIIYLLKNIYLAFLAWVRVKYSTKVQRELSLKMIHSYLNRGYAFLRNTNYSVFSRGCVASIGAIHQILNCFFRILTDGFTLVSIFVFIAITDFWMALSMTCVAALALFAVTVLFRKSVKKAGRVFFEHESKSSQYLHQLFYGIKEIIVMNRVPFFTKTYTESYYKQQKASITQTLAQTYPTYFIETLCVAGIMTAVCIRINSIDNPAAYVAQLATFAVAAFRILPSIGRISSTFSYFIFQIPSANEVYENMKEAAVITTSAEYDQDVGNETAVFSNSLEIHNITFRYPDGQQNVLEHVSLTVKKGEAVAFVGPSGAGKSTLADIILGLFSPQEGSVLMDGKDILRNRIMWSANVGFVPQSVYLMDDTVRRNIAFGHTDEEIDDELVLTALEKAQMKEFILGLPKGMDTIVGERGVKFSGGQAQRLAIARALYNDPQILILDEATSALDNSTEHAIMDAINALQGEKTLIIIAHRLTTVKECDHIYEIRDAGIKRTDYNDLV